MSELQTEELKKLLPSLSDPGILEELQEESHVKHFEEGDLLMERGQFIRFVPIVISGAIRILRVDEEGKEVFLYYLNPGDSCALSLTCCSAHKPSEIKAVADEPTDVIMLPVHLHEEWTSRYKSWKDYVSLTYQRRFQEVLGVIDAVAFKKMDERLLNYLLAKFKQHRATEIHITHQQIATELGTSREVVSRLLKQLEKRKIIELGRNTIYVRDDFDEIV